MTQSEFTDISNSTGFLSIRWLLGQYRFTGPLWQHLPSLAFSDDTGLAYAGPLATFGPLRGLCMAFTGPLRLHIDPIGPPRLWPSLAHLHLDNVDIFLAHSDSTDLLQQYWPLLAHLDPTSPLDNTSLCWPHGPCLSTRTAQAHSDSGPCGLVKGHACCLSGPAGPVWPAKASVV